MKRRALLSAVGVAGLSSLAGCSALSDDELPAGSLQFENRHDLPHVIRFSVVDVGERPGDEPGAVTGDVTVRPAQRELTAASSVAPSETQTFESVFTNSAWYSVEFAVDGRRPDHDTGRTVYNPAPADREYGMVLSGSVESDGGFTWVQSATENRGELTLGESN